MDLREIRSRELIKHWSNVEDNSIGLASCVACFGQRRCGFGFVLTKDGHCCLDLRVALLDLMLVDVVQCERLSKREQMLRLIVAAQ